jgi:hypothetical protein
MRWGLGFQIIERERQEAVDRAMVRYRAEKAREKARRSGLGRGTRTMSREAALNRIAKTHPLSALKILNGYRLGGRKPVPERRGN